MPPKKGAKKGKKGGDDDDAYWEQKAAELERKNQELAAADDESKGGAKGFGAFDMLDDEDEEGGGLMSTIKSSSKKKDKKSKKKRAGDDDEEEDENNAEFNEAPKVDTTVNIDDEWPEEDVKPKKGKKGKKGGKKAQQDDEEDEPVVAAEPVDDAPQPETAVNIDDEWPEEDVKPKKGKKGKKGKKAQQDDDEDDWFVKPDEKKEEAVEEPKAAEVKEAAPAAAEPQAEADEEDDGPKILTKAQKEKLKKEKEKAKKKAQAAAKKGTAEPTPSTPEPSAPAPAADAEEDEGDDDAAGDKKKKKKKKAAAKPAEAPAPAAGKGKKVPAHIAAMHAAMAEKKRLEEEAAAAEAERIRKIEEEDARIAEEEERIAREKAAKKAKEREKQAKAKAEGRLLTPAQKREKAAAEARKAAMLASGVVVAGLQENAGEKKQKPVYGRKKPAKKDTKDAGPSTPPVSSPKPAEPEPEATPAPAAEEDEDDWDKESDKVEAVTNGVDKLKVEESEDDWDKSSESESEEASKVAPAPSAPKEEAKPKVAPAPAAKPTPAPAKSAPAKPAPKTNGKSAPVEESSEEEDSDDDDDDSEDDSDDETDSDEEDSEDELEMRKQRAMQKIQERQKAAEAAKSKDDLRSPICCILGHVDTGKTKLLDKIRQTSVQEGEAGGITQQIGATFFPRTAIQEKTAVVNQADYEVKIPGLLIIDTPGHESFTNLRTRGSSLCNIAILVVDITHGLEPQTIESLNLLRNGKTPFIVALNKIDRMYGWKAIPNGGFRETLASQNASVRSEFEDRVKKTKLAFAEQGLNAEIFDENKNLARNVSLVPTSAISGEGIPDMLMLLVKLTQERMNASLMFITELECTILEVKQIEGLGTTLDVVLSNGKMKEGDRIVLCGMDGPIVTTVRALLTPQPLREMRVKSQYVHHKEVKAALGVKIAAPGLEKAIAGARLYVAQDDDEVEAYKDLAMQDVNDLQRYATKGPGVWVQASTLGALEALLTFLQQMKIPVRNFALGTIFRSHVLRAGRMLDVAAEYALILAFDVNVDKDAKEYAEKEGVKIFSAEIIYHLFDAFTKYMGEVQEAKRQAAMPNAVWPVKLKILKAFALRDPIVLGVDIIEGTLRTGTPVGVVRTDKESGKREIVTLGKITSIELNHKPIDVVKRTQIGAGAAVKIERASYQSAKLYGRHFDDKDDVVSLITRQSIDTLKTSFRDQVDMADWALIKKMKVEQGIQ